MNIQKTPIPIFVYIDSQNLFKSLGENNLEPDYPKILEYLQTKYKAQKVFIFLRHTFFQKDFFNYLRSLGFIVKTTLPQVEYKDLITGKSKTKSNVDGDLIITAVVEYVEKQNHNMILISGDGDFLPLVLFYENRDKLVQIIAINKSKTSKFLQRKSKKQSLKPRNITYIEESLLHLTKKVLPISREPGDLER